MVDIQTVSIAIASAGVFAAAIYYIFQIRHQTRIRQTDLIMRLYSMFGSREFAEAFERIKAREFQDHEDYEKKYGWTEYGQVGTLFEGIGILLSRRLIDFNLVDALFGEPVKRVWKSMKPIIESDRKHNHQPRIFEWFEYLFNEIQKRG